MPEALRGVEKAAVLLLALGTESASDVLRHLDEREVREISRALARVRALAPEHVVLVQQEFQRQVGDAGHAVDGKEFARAVVTRALGNGNANGNADARHAGRGAEILTDLERAGRGDDTGSLGRHLDGVPAERLAEVLEGEHPQVSALILGHLGAARAGVVLGLLPEALQADLVDRLAKLTTVPPGVVAEVGAIMREQLAELVTPENSTVGGPKMVAEILNNADKAVEERVLEAIGNQDGELAATIRGLMFTFEDLIKLDNRGLQSLLKDVPREDLLLALKTASPNLADKLFANMSSRAAELVREDLAASGPARLKDVDAAQARVVAVLRKLEAEGKVTIAGAGRGDVLV
jgi:flagellar motor switch protein FliG